MVAVNPTKGFLYVITKEHPTLDKLALPGQDREGGRGVPSALPAASVDVTPSAAPADGFTRYRSPVNFMTQSGGLSAMGPHVVNPHRLRSQLRERSDGRFQTGESWRWRTWGITALALGLLAADPW